MLSLGSVPVVILAGGLATRLRPITESIPKAMVPVSGRPFIDHQLELLRQQGIQRVILCTGHLGEQIQNHVGNGQSFGLHVFYSNDGPTPLGTGGAVRKALPLIPDACIVLYGDSYLTTPIQSLIDCYNESEALGVMTVYRNDNAWDQSNIVYRDGEILLYRKANPIPDMRHIDYGMSLLSRQAIERIAPERHVDLSTLFTDLVERRMIAGLEVFDRFFEIGSHQGLADTEWHLSRAG